MNGTVIVECIIDKTGRVREAQVLSSTSPLFNQSAVDAVQQWQFAPGSLHGHAIDTIFESDRDVSRVRADHVRDVGRTRGSGGGSGLGCCRCRSFFTRSSWPAFSRRAFARSTFPTRAPRTSYAIPIITLPVQVPPALGVPDGGHKQADSARAGEGEARGQHREPRSEYAFRNTPNRWRRPRLDRRDECDQRQHRLPDHRRVCPGACRMASASTGRLRPRPSLPNLMFRCASAAT